VFSILAEDLRGQALPAKPGKMELIKGKLPPKRIVFLVTPTLIDGRGQVAFPERHAE
jgi:hypothetical protein